MAIAITQYMSLRGIKIWDRGRQMLRGKLFIRLVRELAARAALPYWAKLQGLPLPRESFKFLLCTYKALQTTNKSYHIQLI